MSLKLPRKEVIKPYSNSSSSSALLMGSNFSQSKPNKRNYTSNSEYGRNLTEKSMGSGASSQRDSPGHYRNRGASLSDGALSSNVLRTRNLRYGLQHFSGSSPQIPRPLPHGPGPLLPNNNSTLKVNKRRQEMNTTKARGPVKANHEIRQKSSSSPENSRNVSSPRNSNFRKPPIPIQTLSRAKSRSLNDVRAVENRQDQKPSADKMLTEADLKKAKRSFKISRSPSCDNLNSQRQFADHRALLDKMSKISTDESKDKRTETFRRDSYKPSNLHSDKSKNVLHAPKSNDIKTKNKLNSIQNDSVKIVKDSVKITDSHDQNFQRNSPVSRRDYVLPPSRKLSDSAYESNSTTSSGSSNSSPRIIRNEVILLS